MVSFMRRDGRLEEEEDQSLELALTQPWI